MKRKESRLKTHNCTCSSFRFKCIRKTYRNRKHDIKTKVLRLNGVAERIATDTRQCIRAHVTYLSEKEKCAAYLLVLVFMLNFEKIILHWIIIINIDTQQNSSEKSEFVYFPRRARIVTKYSLRCTIRAFYVLIIC